MDLAISVQNLRKSFNNSPAVNNINLSVKKGEVFGFLGPNGSGKTTTIRMLCGLLKPDSGSGHCLGYNITTQTSNIKQHVGYMTQKFSLYEDLTVTENLQFIAKIYNIPHNKIQDTLDQFHFPTTRLHQLASELSGGWKQRLALAATTLPQPQLLLLDEPTAGVDPKARREFWDHIHRLAASGITALVTTHYMDEAERCHRLAYLVNGSIKTHGTQSEIINSSKLITFQITGHPLNELAEKFRQSPDIQQVAHFGNSLHLSGTNQNQLEATIKRFITPSHTATPIDPTLEDIFMTLSS